MLKCLCCCDTGWVLEPAKIVGKYPPGTRLSAMKILPEVWRLCACQIPIAPYEFMGYRVDVELVDEAVRVRLNQGEHCKERIYTVQEVRSFLCEAENKMQLQQMLALPVWCS